MLIFHIWLPPITALTTRMRDKYPGSLDIYTVFHVQQKQGKYPSGLLPSIAQPMESTMDKQHQDNAQNSNMVKDPNNWTTGDEPMTGAQKS